MAVIFPKCPFRILLTFVAGGARMGAKYGAAAFAILESFFFAKVVSIEYCNISI
jgi:hypothetical protein